MSKQIKPANKETYYNQTINFLKVGAPIAFTLASVALQMNEAITTNRLRLELYRSIDKQASTNRMFTDGISRIHQKIFDVERKVENIREMYDDDTLYLGGMGLAGQDVQSDSTKENRNEVSVAELNQKVKEKSGFMNMLYKAGMITKKALSKFVVLGIQATILSTILGAAATEAIKRGQEEMVFKDSMLLARVYSKVVEGQEDINFRIDDIYRQLPGTMADSIVTGFQRAQAAREPTVEEPQDDYFYDEDYGESNFSY